MREEASSPKGYPKIAFLMSKSPEFSIFRRYGALNAKNLLYLQAELKNLEAKLHDFETADESSQHEDRMIYSRDWETLKDSCEADAIAGNDKNQWRTILEIREKLREYSHLDTLVHC
ncbi:hypothetical protein MMC14_002550, partial [Varicellaria rhodocarpa]|nr:hypothetical protein [Varicellaria rhodocarpa]